MFMGTAVGWIWPDMSNYTQTCLNLSLGDCGWSGGGIVKLKIVQNESWTKF